MRVAQLEMKMGLARLFRTFSLVTCAETEVGWDYEKGIVFRTVYFMTFGIFVSPQDPLQVKSLSTLGPKNGIFVKIQKRDVNQGPSGTTADQ